MEVDRLDVSLAHLVLRLVLQGATLTAYGQATKVGDNIAILAIFGVMEDVEFVV